MTTFIIIKSLKNLKFIFLINILFFSFLFNLSLIEAKSLNEASQEISEIIAEDISNFLKSTPSFNNSSVAVLNFKIFNPKGYINVDEYFSDILSVNLTRKSNFKVLERLKLKSILKEQTLNMSGFTTGDKLEVGKILNVSGLILGDLVISNQKLGVNVRLVEVESGKIIWANYYETLLNSDIAYIPFELNQFLWIETVKGAIGKTTKNLIKNINLKDKIIVVYNLKTIPEGAGIEDILTSLLITELVKNHIFVVEREKLNSILNEISFSQSGLTEEDKSIKAGKLLGATESILGSVSINQKGELYDIFGEKKRVIIEGNISLKLISVKSSEILASVNENFKKKF